MSGQVQILDQLKQGKYASQIARDLNFSRKKIFIIIKQLRHLGYIRRDLECEPKIPKYYKITEKGRSFLDTINFTISGQSGHTSEKILQKKIENKILDQKTKPKKIRSISIHKLRFKQGLINKASWLYQISSNLANTNGFLVKRIKMNNWDKFILYINNYNKFGGIHNIEICNNYVIYNFRKIKTDSVVTTSQGLKNFMDELIQDCKKAGDFLTQKGFDLDPHDPIRAQKHHFVVETEDGYHVKDIGKYLELHIKQGDSTLIFDDSPGDGGEMEVDNQKNAETILDESQNIETIRDDVNELKTQMSALISEISNLVKVLTPQPPQTITKKPPRLGGQYI